MFVKNNFELFQIVPRTNARDPVAKARYGRPEGAESRGAFSSDDSTANTLGTRSVDSD